MLSLFAAAALAAQSPTPCTPETSIRTTVADIGRNSERFMGKCVTVAGPFGGVSVYGSVEDIYLSSQFGPDGNYNRTAGRNGRLGLYSPDNALLRLKPVRTRRIEVTGTVDSCERRSDAARAQEKADLAQGKISLISLSGYCHFRRGAIVSAVDWSFDPPQRYERLTGEHAREVYGNIVEMDDDWPFARELHETSAAFLAAFRAGDRDRLMALHDFTDPKHVSNARVMTLLLDQPDSPFAQIRSNPAPQTQFFVSRYEAGQVEAGKRPKLASGIACYCRTKDCTGRWPISRNDADNLPERPYACTWIRKEDWPGGKVIVETRVGETRWLAEPARTAFHPR